jgi:hypothetical protein
MQMTIHDEKSRAFDDETQFGGGVERAGPRPSRVPSDEHRHMRHESIDGDEDDSETWTEIFFASRTRLVVVDMC